MADIYAPPNSVVTSISAQIGDRVEKGQVLAVVSNEIYGVAGSLGDQERRFRNTQISEVTEQIAASRTRSAIEGSKLRNEVIALQLSIGTLQNQKSIRERQRDLAQSQYNNFKSLAEKGYVSKSAQDNRQQSILNMEQAVLDIQREIDDQRAKIRTLESSSAESIAEQRSSESQLRATRENLRSGIIDLDYRTAASIRAPVAGTVAAVNVRVGETARPSLPIASVAPPGRPAAELLLATRGAGFVKPGQDVRVLIDAFPFERYGAFRGVVAQVARTSIDASQISPAVEVKGSVYRVRVRLLDRKWNANERPLKLQPGMTLRADILTDRRTLLQWLIDPILSAKGL